MFVIQLGQFILVGGVFCLAESYMHVSFSFASAAQLSRHALNACCLLRCVSASCWVLGAGCWVTQTESGLSACKEPVVQNPIHSISFLNVLCESFKTELMVTGSQSGSLIRTYGH